VQFANEPADLRLASLAQGDIERPLDPFLFVKIRRTGSHYNQLDHTGC
jgi:hypothetical protein